MAQLDDDLKNLTPEQVLELQKQQCIFCQIIAGKVQTRRIYEDEKALAILDINPANPGHILLLPKEHYAILPQMPDELIGHIFTVAKHISHALLRAFKVGGTTIYVANGAVAGQRAPHFMVHIIPRTAEDGIKSLTIPSKSATEQQLDELKALLFPKVNEIFGIKKVEPIKLDKSPERIEVKSKMIAEKTSDQKASNGGKEFKEEERIKEKIDLDRVSEALFKHLGGR